VLFRSTNQPASAQQEAHAVYELTPTAKKTKHMKFADDICIHKHRASCCWI